ncbi:apolipoprotein B-100-like [Synchiropus picturatus]
MMGGTKLGLLLLMATYTLAQQDIKNVDDQVVVCSMEKRLKNFKQYVYDYQADSLNGVPGASDYKSGPTVTCKVEIDVPRTCAFVMRTTECSLTEIFDVDGEGNLASRPAAGARAFKAAMAKNPLRFTVEGESDVKLIPGDDPVNILNIKRGIISSLLVPFLDEEKNQEMATVHGVCPTDVTINAREDIATDVTLSRDLASCDMFTARKQASSPLAIISGMNYPLSKLISSSQKCDYKFDNQKKHMTSGSCVEKHIFLPFSHQNEYGISTLVKQTVTLREVSKINDRVFDADGQALKTLAMEVADDKLPVQTKQVAMTTFQELNTLTETTRGEERASIFARLVSEIRGLKVDVLRPAALEMAEQSLALTLQTLVQCGTPECGSALLSVLRTFDTAALEVDATVYAMSLVTSPSRLMVSDMLEMAKYKQSKAIMYALSREVKKLYAEEKKVTPEITAVYEFIASLLGADCAGDKDLTFLALRVVGNMGEVMEAADPTIRMTLLKCMRQPATTLSVQLAAIQAFRHMTLSEEVRTNLQRVSQYPKGAVQKRLAAYLIVMKDPRDSDIEMVKKLLKQEQNMQVKSFVSSHVYNIMTSTHGDAKMLGEKLLNALQDTDVTSHIDFTVKSRNYKLAMLESNMIFDPTSQVPREVMLKTTLDAFGYNMDFYEVGLEGKGFEPTIDALFGKNGFFPDAVSKAIYWTEDKMPSKINEVLKEWVAPLKMQGQKVPEDLVREIVRSFSKTFNGLMNQESPETMAYLRLLGNEMGFMKGSELKTVAQNIVMYSDILFKIIPGKFLNKIMSGTNNNIFAHYIFMDNKFVLPTASGLPLTFALSGTFTPGAKGGISFTRDLKEVMFRPEVGVEVLTKMGVHMPEFVVSAVEMHTNLYHESTLNAKLSMEASQIKISIPAIQETTKFLRISNKVMIVGGGYAPVIPANEGVGHCDMFAGIKYCTESLRAVSSKDTAPYFPLTGEYKYALNLKPNRDVTEYTATVAYKMLNEGKDGRQMVDSVKMTLRAEGTKPTEGSILMKYNRNRNVFTSQLLVPDFDVEAGVKVGFTDSNNKGKSLILELSNKNVPQLSLTGRAQMKAMMDGMLQVQLLVPILRTDATVTATMNRAAGLTMQVKSDVKVLETSSMQAVTFRYAADQLEVEVMSNMNADTTTLVRYNEASQIWLGSIVAEAMDQQVPKTDMKVRHIVKKGLEATDIWRQKVANEVPYVDMVMKSVEKMEMPSMPENLFMNFETKFIYQFNQDSVTIRVPLPYGGKSSEELMIPAVVKSPHVSVPRLGLNMAPREIAVPTFTIPAEHDLTLPLMGKMEMSAKLNSNYYNWEATASAGNNTVQTPNFAAKFKVMADSPITILSFKTEGAAEITDTEDKTMKVTVDGSLEHELIKTSVNVLETLAVTDSVKTTGRYSLNAASPVGVRTALALTNQFSLDSKVLSGDINADASATIGALTGTTTYLNTFSIEPAKKEARMESNVNVNSDIVMAGNKIKATYANNELLIESNTNLKSWIVEHTTKSALSYKEVQLLASSNSVTKIQDSVVRNQVELSASGEQASLRIENHAGDSVYTLLTGSLNPSGLELNGDASVNTASGIASHKATLALNMNGLTTSCTTAVQYSPLAFENVFHGGVDINGATASLTTKGGIRENNAELNVEGKLAPTDVYINGMLKGSLFDFNTRNRANFRLNENGLILSNNVVGSFGEMKTDNTNSLSLSLRSFTLQSKTENVLTAGNSYMHDITVNMERYKAAANVKNQLMITGVNFVNEAQFKAEPYNMETTGTVMATYKDEELKHTYEIKFVDMIFSTKCNTNGKLFGTQMSHATEVELAGLTLSLKNLANFKSASLLVDSNTNAIIEPFTLNVDVVFTSNGDLYLFGKHSGEVYSKFLLKAEPFNFRHSLEQRASTTHVLTGKPTFTSMFDNKFSSVLNLEEQSVVLKMKSNVNQHSYTHEFDAYNKAERMGVEMKGTVTTNLLTETSQDYSVSGFLKYDKNSDSHFIQIPFIEYLPAVIENTKASIVRLMDVTLEMLKDINTKYEITTRIQNKVGELKSIIDDFDYNVFVRDIKRFVSSVEATVMNLKTKIPTDKIMEVLKTIREAIMTWIKKYNISARLNIMYEKIEELLSSYEVEKMIGAIMDQVVDMMKKYQIREKIQYVFTSLKSIDIKPLFQKMMAPAQELLNEVYTFDYKQLIEDVSSYFMALIQKLKSFDYDTVATQLKEKVTDMSMVPCFGKLYGEFKVTSPHYKLKTNADLENTTTTSISPEFKFNLKSEASSTLRALDFNLDASALLALPKMSQLSVSETIKIDQSAFTLDHQGDMTLFTLPSEARATTTANFNTEILKAELVNNANFAIGSGVSAEVETKYKHNMNMPPVDFTSDMSMTQKTMFVLEDGTASLTMNNLANAKYFLDESSDELAHKSDMEVTMDLHTAKVTFADETSCKFFKTVHNLAADICIFRHVMIDASTVTEAPFLKTSVAELKFQAKTEDMKIHLTASHNTEMTDFVISNSALALVTPAELTFDTKNKLNSKMRMPFPVSLPAKVDLENNMGLSLTAGMQQASWTGLARFNQYKYAHQFAANNAETEITVDTQINAEANLDFLKRTFTIPSVTVPYFEVTTPEIKDFSLWLDAGLAECLLTTEQTFDFNSKLKYKKNPEMITIIELAPIVKAINMNMKALHKRMLIGKDNAAAVLASTYNRAQAEYEKYSIELPKTITVPGYKVPVINVEMSAFTIPLPDGSLITMPTLHVPSALSKLTLPKITLPKVEKIVIPKMGDLMHEFNLKTPMITLKSDASFLNRDSITAQFDASSTAKCQFLSGKIQGSIDVTTAAQAFKVASVLTAKHMLLEVSHDGSVDVTAGNLDASMTNSARVHYDDQTMEVKQVMIGNPTEGVVMSLSTPSAGLIAVQMQSKRQQVKARVYGRYPSEPTKDVDIIVSKITVMNSEKMNIQTSWNMEIPNEVMLKVNEKVPILFEIADNAVNEISAQSKSVQRGINKMKRQGKAMMKRATDSLREVELPELMTTVSNFASELLQRYQRSVLAVLDAAFKFIKETQFRIPGTERKMTGLEIFQECRAFVVDVIEQLIQKVPVYFDKIFTQAIEYIRTLYFVVPGTDFVVSGDAFVKEFSVIFRRVQGDVLFLVRQVGQIDVKDFYRMATESVKFVVKKSEQVLQTVRTMDMESVVVTMEHTYNDMSHSRIAVFATKKFEALMEYLIAVRAKVEDMWGEVSTSEVQANIQGRINSFLKEVNAVQNRVIMTVKEKSQIVEPYVRVSDRQVDLDIPFPFVASYN